MLRFCDRRTSEFYDVLRRRKRVFLLMCCSLACLAKEQHLSFDDGVDTVYDITFDDRRISEPMMREIAWLSPWVNDESGPYLMGFSEQKSAAGKTIVDKVLMAPPLELCVEQQDPNCKLVNPEVLNSAWLENARRNLQRGDDQFTKLSAEKLPHMLEPVRTYLMMHLKLSLEREKVREDYLSTGNLKEMREVLCRECSCGTREESLLEELGTATDPRRRLELSRFEWANMTLKCQKNRYPSAYPMQAWERFLHAFGIKERRRHIPVD